ncbi:hypothetical protein N9A47_04625 [Flavobacteriaceae bacterium]|nr:hypothetical protein [Flavobacteriaceae bacterium]
MTKGLLILFTVFAVIALLNFSSLKLMKLEAVKKAKFRKVFFYFYGLFQIFTGVVNCIEQSELNIIFIIEILIGVVFLVGNYLGKLEEKKLS